MIDRPLQRQLIHLIRILEANPDSDLMLGTRSVIQGVERTAHDAGIKSPIRLAGNHLFVNTPSDGGCCLSLGLNCEVAPRAAARLREIIVSRLRLWTLGTEKNPRGRRPVAGKPKRRRRRANLTPKELTPKQAEAVQIVGECKGDLAEAARRLGIDRKTVKQHYDAAMKKMGKSVVKHATRPLRIDRRGQANLSEDDDRRR